MSKKEVYYPDEYLFNHTICWGGKQKENPKVPKNLEKLVQKLMKRKDFSQEIISGEIDYEDWYAEHTHHIWSKGEFLDSFWIGKFYKELITLPWDETKEDVLNGFDTKLNFVYMTNKVRLEMGVIYWEPHDNPGVEEYQEEIKKKLDESLNDPKETYKVIKLKKSEVLEIIKTAKKEKDFMGLLLE